MHAIGNRSNSRDSAEANRIRYDELWTDASIACPERFNTWAIVSALVPGAPERLEIGPGLRPRLPICGTHFIDISAPVVRELTARGGTALCSDISTLPFSDGRFDLVCAFDVIEHVRDDDRVFAELSRVLKDNGTFIFSVPLHADQWTEFDDWAGHERRYDPAALLAILAHNCLVPVQSAAFGMQPSNPRLVKLGIWCLKHSWRQAMFFYNKVFMPLGLYFQKKLEFANGLMDTTGVDEIVLVCRRPAH